MLQIRSTRSVQKLDRSRFALFSAQQHFVGAVMSSIEARIVSAARAWAQALTELEEAKQQAEADGEVLKSAELAVDIVAARVEVLRSAERALYQAVQLSGAMPR
jgi:dihydroxyacetone kinase-like predicted kinase